jgi:RNA polymerase sigma-70 factor (ECF subfamily)
MVTEKQFEEITRENFNSYYSKYFPKLVYFLSSYSKDAMKAEDLAQETFIQCLEKIQDYNPETSRFSTWMYTVGRNLALQKIKKEDRLPTSSMDQVINDEGFKLSDIMCYDDNTEEFYQEKIYQIKARIMVEEIQALPEKYRRVISMRELENKPYEIISNEIKLNLNTVKSQIKQGRTILMKNVKKKFEILDSQGIDIELVTEN